MFCVFRFSGQPEVIKAALVAALTPHISMMVAAAGGLPAARAGWTTGASR